VIPNPTGEGSILRQSRVKVIRLKKIWAQIVGLIICFIFEIFDLADVAGGLIHVAYDDFWEGVGAAESLVASHSVFDRRAVGLGG
jgi:hypothetical protein